MEIFIIGAIIVALMAYASTKIKRAAREAYEEEIFENEYFTITKPEGFIIPVKDNSEFILETYSKDFGADETEKFYQCRATVREERGIAEEGEPEEREITENDVSFRVFSQRLVNNELAKSFALEVSVLSEYEEKYAERIKILLDTFALK